MQLYVRRHEEGLVETIDLIRSFEEASGKNLTGFFDQWVMSPGHPDLEGSLAWEEKDRWVRLTLKQTQKTEGGIPACFRIPVRIECRMDDDTTITDTFLMDRPEQTFYVELAGKPVTVVIDPELAVLATWKVTRPLEWCEATLLGRTRHPSVPARFDALRRAAENPTWQAESLIGRVLLEDPFWAVQAEAAKLLGKIRSPHCLELLLGALDLPHPKARRGVVRALGAFRTPAAAESLRKILRTGDESYFVEAAAAAALGQTAQPGVAEDLRAALSRPSWHDILAMSAAEGFAATRDESVVGKPPRHGRGPSAVLELSPRRPARAGGPRPRPPGDHLAHIGGDQPLPGRSGLPRSIARATGDRCTRRGPRSRRIEAGGGGDPRSAPCARISHGGRITGLAAQARRGEGDARGDPQARGERLPGQEAHGACRAFSSRRAGRIARDGSFRTTRRQARARRQGAQEAG